MQKQIPWCIHFLLKARLGWLVWYLDEISEYNGHFYPWKIPGGIWFNK